MTPQYKIVFFYHFSRLKYFKMKYFIAFALLLLAHCLAPSASLAITNAKKDISSSTILVNKQLNFKEQRLFKMAKRKVEPTKKKNTSLIVGIVFLLLGLILFFSSSSKPSNSTTNEYPGLGQLLLGVLSFGLGCIILLVRFINRLPINNPKKAS
jgi:hypothetical protein